jgi:GH24 family phage-related lysozyme (muramidase)
MSQNLTISDTGLKLIKAFEGYRPVDRELITGQRIVGYGHRLYSEDAVMMNKGEAESVLRGDLEPFEDMINSEVHAPMTQSQFDALCSFAFNIGPKAFLKSDTLRALNNGRPLDAANGLDVWRKSEIAGKTYVVDALMRRRTAEKALFLRTERNLSAGREDLPPIQDTAIQGMSTDDELPVFTEDDANGIVATAPYTATAAPTRRREDGAAGVLQLSELDIDDGGALPEATVPGRTLADRIMGRGAPESDVSTDIAFDLDEDEFEGEDFASADDGVFESDETKPSPIAAAATDIVARLDALIEDADTRFEDRDEDWPETLITAETAENETETVEMVETKRTKSLQDNVIDLNTRTTRPIETMADAPAEIEGTLPLVEEAPKNPVGVIDELAKDDAIRVRTDSAAKYIETGSREGPPIEVKKTSGLGLWIPVMLGFLLLGAAAGTLIRGAEALLGVWGPIIAFTGLVIGVGLILAGIYAALRINSRS